MSRTRFIPYEKTGSGLVARGFGVAFLAVVGCFLLPLEASAWTEYPRKPIKVIVPFGSGGASDNLVWSFKRAIHENELSDVPLVVVNVPGAGGTIGSRRVKNGRPDGYTILNLHDGIMTAQASGLSRFGPEAFQPIAATGFTPTVLCMAPDAPWKEIDELLAEAKDKPDTIQFGANPGAPSHFIALRLEKAVDGARFRMVPAGGGAKRFTALIGGHLDVSIFSVSEYLQFREGGLRALAFLGKERHPVLKAVSTGRERGIDVVSGTTQYWWAPQETPPDRVAHLADLLEAALETERLQKSFAQLSIEPLFLRDEALARHLEEERARYAELAVEGESYETPLPRLAIGLVLLFAVLLAGHQVLNRRRADPAATGPPGNWGLVLLLLGTLLTYIVLLGLRWIPFALATVAFVAGSALLLARTRRERIGALVLAGALTLFLQIIFQRVLVIDLP